MSIFGPNIKGMRNRKDIKGLIRLFTHQNRIIRQNSSEALAQIGQDSILPIIDIISDGKRQASEIVIAKNTLVKIGSVCIPQLVTILDSANLDRRFGKQIIEVLDALKWEPENKTLKIKYLKIKKNRTDLVKVNDNPEDQNQRLPHSSTSKDETPKNKPAGETGDSESVDRLAKIVSNRWSEIRDRIVAINSLVKIGTEDSIKALVELLHNEPVVIEIFNKEIKNDSGSYIPSDIKKHQSSRLQKCIENEEMIMKAIVVLMIQNGEKLINELIKGTTAKSDIRIKEIVLQMIEKEDAKPEYLSKLLILGSEYKWILPVITTIPRNKKEKIHYLLYKNDIKRLIKIKDVFEILASAFPDEELKFSIIKVFGELKDPRAIKLLIPELKKKKTDTDNSEQALISLTRIGGPEVIEPILQYIYNNIWIPSSSHVEFDLLFKDYSIFIFSPISYRSNSEYDSKEQIHYNYTLDLSPAENGVKKLCTINTPISNNLLHMIKSIHDKNIKGVKTVSKNGYFSDKIVLNFQTVRDLAREELYRRGNPKYDPKIYYTENAWTIK